MAELLPPVIVSVGLNAAATAGQLAYFTSPTLIGGASGVTVTNVAGGSKIGFGTAPGTTGAINVDTSSYGGVGARFVNGTVILSVAALPGETRLYNISADPLRLGANNLLKWKVLADAAGTASLQSEETTARIVGGSSNGLAVRNSGNTFDTFAVIDTGGSALLQNLGQAALGGLYSQAAIDEIPKATLVMGGNATTGGWLKTNVSGNVGILAGIGYWNGANWKSAVEVPNVNTGAGTFSTLSLMKSGGPVIIQSGVAIPAAGALTSKIGFSSTAAFGIFWGSGAPTIAAAKGSLYIRSDGTGTTDRAFIATDSAGTWTALTTVA